MNKRIKEVMQGVVIVIVFTVMFGMCSYVEHHYTRKGCTVVQTEGHTVTVEDKTGYTWCYEVDGEAPEVGTKVDIHMYTNLTDNYIFDDEVVGVSTH